MYSIPFKLDRSRPSRRAMKLLSLAGGLWLACLGAGTASAQTFVTEWAEADIGRIGPTSLAIDTVNGATYLYATDDPGGRIIKIDLATGNRVGAYGQTGNGPLEFNAPYGVAIEPVSHDLYVAERGNHRVQRITADGKFVMGWGSLGTAPGQFDSPIGIAADSKGNVYVVDHNNNRVQKFHVSQNTDGTWNVNVVAVWGSPGAAKGQFNAPYGITLDPGGNLWVADGRNHRLQKFDPNGNFLDAVGTFGTGDGQFITPVWVNFDAAGNYYVAETNSDPQNPAATDIQNQRVQKFTSANAFVLKWGSYGEAGGQFKLPFDAIPDANGNIYVADYYNTRLQKFTFNSTPPPPPPGNGSQFSNVSSRLRTNPTAGRELIGGFYVSGSTPKQLLIRAVGPTLAKYGVTTPLPNPSLEVISGKTTVAQNDDWGNDPAITAVTPTVGAFPLDANSKDAAVLVTLAPGQYSAKVDTNGGDGVALVEVYDVDKSAATKLINLSTRGFVDVGDVLVAGFAVSGSTAKKVLIRGVGPTLANYGVTGPLPNPVLKIHGSNGTVLVAQNDDWGTPQAVPGQAAPASGADISAAAGTCGAFGLPSGSKDAAVVVTLAPGAYTAEVVDATGATGTALVEVYELSSP
jgi:sugar lactone lactonase YvrE